VTPNENRNGPASFDYVIEDGTGRSSTATVTIELAAVNDAPVIGDITLSGTEDTGFSATLDPSLFSDAEGDAINVSVRGVGDTPLPAWLGFSLATFTLSGTPPGDFNGDVPLEIVANDGRDTSVRAVTLTIEAVNDAPVIGPVSLQSAEDTAIDITLDAGLISDVDGDTLIVALRRAGDTALPAWLSFDAATGQITGTPPSNLNGDFALELVADDGTATTVQPVNFELTAVNDAPVAGLDTVDGGTQEIIAIALADLLANDSDVDGDTLSIAGALGGDGFVAALDGLDNLVVSRDPGFEGRIDVGYTLTTGRSRRRARC